MKKITFLEIMDALSHDLKSPIASVQSIAALLAIKREKLTPDDILSYVHKIDTKMQLLNENIDALFELAVFQENKQELTMQFVDLRNTLALVIEKFGQRFSLQKTDEDKNELVQGDPQQLQQAFKVFCEHLDRVADEGSTIAITTRVSDTLIQITYAYTGQKLLSDEVAESFEIPHFLAAINKTVHLSLYNAVQRILLHAGTVQYRSAENNQYTLVVTLPLQE